MEKSAASFLSTCPWPLKAALREVDFAPGEIIMAQGDELEAVYFLLEGEAKVYHLTLSGIHILEYIYSTGELFGEIEALNNKPVLTDIRASEECKTVRVAKDDFLAWFRQDPDFASFIGQQMADKLYRACLTWATNTVYPLKYRVLYYLWTNAQTGKTVLKDDIVTGLGSIERSVNRIIKDLVDEGLIVYEEGEVEVLSTDAVLREMRRYE